MKINRTRLSLIFFSGLSISLLRGDMAKADIADVLAGGVAGGYAIGNLGPTFYAFNNLQPTLLTSQEAPAPIRRHIKNFSGKIIASYNPSLVSASRSYDYTQLRDIVNISNIVK